MRVKRQKNGHVTYVYNTKNGQDPIDALLAEIKKAEKSLASYKETIEWWRWNFEEVKKGYEFRKQKIKDLEDFIRLATDKVNELRVQKEAETTQEGDQNEG